eukprot:s126_g18.t1
MRTSQWDVRTHMLCRGSEVIGSVQADTGRVGVIRQSQHIAAPEIRLCGRRNLVRVGFAMGRHYTVRADKRVACRALFTMDRRGHDKPACCMLLPRRTSTDTGSSGSVQETSPPSSCTAKMREMQPEVKSFRAKP